MGLGAAETRDDLVRRRRRRSGLLCLIAGCITALFFIPKGLTDGSPVGIFWLIVSIPSIGFSLAAAYQYRNGEYTGAGAAAAAVSWIYVLLGEFEWGSGFFIQAVLQTCAWYISRPGRKV
ncbi:MAG TPA: hypothetical protein VGN59_09905 [Acidimicrobiia bacterium]|jgi:ABC-type transport system involved in cytochrome c biogenesis permease subunit